MRAKEGISENSSALPSNVSWTPVDEALEILRVRMHPITGVEEIPLSAAAGRIIASPAIARWDVPRQPNAAVDGYAFAAESLAGRKNGVLELREGRAGAGHPYAGAVPSGAALRILTGAPLPEGVDTVVMQEDVRLGENNTIQIDRTPGAGANTRAAAEDIRAGDAVAETGRILRPQDLAQAASSGVARLHVHCRLRVGIVSTGDEIHDPGAAIPPGGIADANRPMLNALITTAGLETVDLGVSPDREEAVRAVFDRAAESCDTLVISGGLLEATRIM